MSSVEAPEPRNLYDVFPDCLGPGDIYRLFSGSGIVSYVEPYRTDDERLHVEIANEDLTRESNRLRTPMGLYEYSSQLLGEEDGAARGVRISRARYDFDYVVISIRGASLSEREVRLVQSIVNCPSGQKLDEFFEQIDEAVQGEVSVAPAIVDRYGYNLSRLRDHESGRSVLQVSSDFFEMGYILTHLAEFDIKPGSPSFADGRREFIRLAGELEQAVSIYNDASVKGFVELKDSEFSFVLEGVDEEGASTPYERSLADIKPAELERLRLVINVRPDSDTERLSRRQRTYNFGDADLEVWY